MTAQQSRLRVAARHMHFRVSRCKPVGGTMKVRAYLGEWHPNPGTGFDMVRVYLGAALFVRGVLFVAHPERLIHYLETSNRWFMPLAASQYVVAAHIGGGFMLALGIGTRLAAAVQVPALLGAVFFVHLRSGLMLQDQSLELASLVLVLLTAFAVFGADKLSLDHLLAKAKVDRERQSMPPTPASPSRQS